MKVRLSSARFVEIFILASGVPAVVAFRREEGLFRRVESVSSAGAVWRRNRIPVSVSGSRELRRKAGTALLTSIDVHMLESRIVYSREPDSPGRVGDIRKEFASS